MEGLRKVPDTKVIVSAPASQQSGTGGKTTPGGAQASDATTASGFPAHAVAGFPADSVNWALDGGITDTPDVVITGINSGENLGKFTELSGTVGAARAAAAHGIPALATSQGIAGTVDFPTGVKYTLDWLAKNRADILAGKYAGKKPAPVWNMNFPNCAAGTTARGVIEVPVDTSDAEQFKQPDCRVDRDEPRHRPGRLRDRLRPPVAVVADGRLTDGLLPADFQAGGDPRCRE